MAGLPEASSANLAWEVWRVLRRSLRRDLNYYRVRPTNLLPFLTYRCSSRCRTCSMWRRESTRPELTLAQWQAFFSSLAEQGPGSLCHVEFFGGDVLLRSEVLLPLIEQAASMGLRTAVPLNMILLDEAMAGRLAASGLETVYVSVDGVGEAHDRVRGVPGNFARLHAGVAALRKARGERAHPSLEAICTVSRFNADSFEQVLPFAIEAGFDRICFEYAGEFPAQAVTQSVIDGRRPRPYFASPDGSPLVNQAEAARIKQQLALMHSSPLARRVSLETKNIDVLTVEQMVGGWVDLRRCYVARLIVSIDPFGDVLACPFFDTYSLGNILERPLSEIWNGPAHRRFLAAQARGALAICRHCILSVERNPTFWQYLVKRYLGWRRMARA